MHNDSFSFRRIALYARKHYIENARFYGFTALAILLALLGQFLLDYNERSYSSNATALAVITGILWLNRTFRPFYKPKMATLNYMLPLTQTEKYFFCWFNSLIAFGTIFTLLYLAAIAFGRITGIATPELGWFPNWYSGEDLIFLLLFQSLAMLVCSGAKTSPVRGYVIIWLATIMFISIYQLSLTRIVPYSDIQIFTSPCSDLKINMYLNDSYLHYRIPPLPGVGIVYWVLIVLGWITGWKKFRERTFK